MMDIQVMFPDNMNIVVVNQVVIGNYGTGDGVFYGHNSFVGITDK